MTKQTGKILVALCALATSVVWVASARAQTSDVKEKPPMYTYVADWAIPRAQWGEMQKNAAATQPMLQKALASGTIVGYGDDVDLLHRPDGDTHDTWWSAMSLAGLINVLEQSYASGGATSPVLTTATKHQDAIYVSRYYNWHSGSWKNVYTYDAFYKLKSDAPDDAVDMLSKNVIVPLMEKMLADGTIHEYEVDTQAFHTEAPGTFSIIYIASSAESLDKVNAAIRDTLKANPLEGPAFGSMVDYTAHRDDLARTNATYK
ncbi:MAG TPA: hypothetical protein VMT28_13825 [Terriglobales bacterium]|jgi:hypothetical protein|nr:hypothetical protein [Terriglobales bacterium]